MKKDLHSKRIELLQNKTKKPTEIIIFTDYHSFSATSIFLKSFQQSGGAIIVGYYGNPKNKEAIKDAGISSSGIIAYERTKYYRNLESLNFSFLITGTEFYYFDYQKINPTPQEYISIPVDEHVDIYEEYSDDIYDKFIQEANRIFEKYNTECNVNNKLLLLEDDNCYNLSDSYAHGGYSCGYEGFWNKSNCQAFYCDIGYYYDTYQKKCIKDICTENGDKEEDDADSIPTWLIIIIVIGSILILLIIIIIIRKAMKSKNSQDLIEISPETKLTE